MANSEAVDMVSQHLREIFGARLQSVVRYGGGDRAANALGSTLAIVDRIGADDLRACADRAAVWRESGAATPLLLAAGEFARSLDAFPFEFGAILADYVVISGTDPFEGLTVEPADLRRACEIQARSHLLHLRENYIETEGRSDALAELIQRSSPPLSVLLRNVARLHASFTADAPLERVARLAGGPGLTSDAARHLFPEYLDALERLTLTLDRWSAR